MKGHSPRNKKLMEFLAGKSVGPSDSNETHHFITFTYQTWLTGYNKTCSSIQDIYDIVSRLDGSLQKKTLESKSSAAIEVNCINLDAKKLLASVNSQLGSLADDFQQLSKPKYSKIKVSKAILSNSGSRDRLELLGQLNNRPTTPVLSSPNSLAGDSPPQDTMHLRISPSDRFLIRFICDSSNLAIYLYKLRVRHLLTTSGSDHEARNPFQAEQVASDQDPTFFSVYSLKSQMDYTSNRISTLVIVKRVPTLNPSCTLD
ncbi:hypothetical protein PPACK8108_LOCUS19885 [Phakopsora pachyrhizi]|uniref:Uncharacterized protein n=1 Tax=Phakopsora pachyrhizi TaxID=170000 RepID=A0AAV0BE14_PHAPC|nr:hypothetical protein PPACK8108_LOCUS19885 [Phakopsora pachyrhizi]